MQITKELVKELNDMMNQGQEEEVSKILDSMTIKEKQKVFELLLTGELK